MPVSGRATRSMTGDTHAVQQIAPKNVGWVLIPDILLAHLPSKLLRPTWRIVC